MNIKNVNKDITYICLLVCSFLIFFCIGSFLSGFVEIGIISAILIIANFRNRTLNIILPSILLMCFMVGWFAFSGTINIRGYNAPIKFVSKFVYLVFGGISGLAMKELSVRRKKNIIKIAIGTMLISSLISIYYCVAVNPDALRYRDIVGINNTFDFNQLYSVTFFFASYIFSYMMNRKSLGNSTKKMIMILTISILLCVIVLSRLTTAILFIVIGVAIPILLDLKKKNAKSVSISIIILLIVLVSVVFRNEISDALVGISKLFPSVVSRRLIRIVDMVFFTTHDNTYTMSRRMELASYSINSFLKSPIIGIGLNNIGYGTIGYHQEWFDFLGVIGLFGTCITMGSMMLFVRNIYKKTNSKIDQRNMQICLILFFILGFLNPCITISSMFTISVLAPNLSVLWERGDNYES